MRSLSRVVAVSSSLVVGLIVVGSQAGCGTEDAEPEAAAVESKVVAAVAAVADPCVLVQARLQGAYASGALTSASDGIGGRATVTTTDAPTTTIVVPLAPTMNAPLPQFATTDVTTTGVQVAELRAEAGAREAVLANAVTCSTEERLACPALCGATDLPLEATLPAPSYPYAPFPGGDVNAFLGNGDIKFPFEQSDIDGPGRGLKNLAFEIKDMAYIPKEIPASQQGRLIQYNEAGAFRTSWVWPIFPSPLPNISQYFRGDDRTASADPYRTGRVINLYTGRAFFDDANRPLLGEGVCEGRCSETMDVHLKEKKAPPAISPIEAQDYLTETPNVIKENSSIRLPEAGQGPAIMVGGNFKITSSGSHPFTREYFGADAMKVKVTTFGGWSYRTFGDAQNPKGLHVLVCSLFAPFPSHDTSFHIGNKSILLHSYDTTQSHPAPALMFTDTIKLCTDVYVNDAGDVYTQRIETQPSLTAHNGPWVRQTWTINPAPPVPPKPEDLANRYCSSWGQQVPRDAKRDNKLGDVCNLDGTGARADAMARCEDHWGTIQRQVSASEQPPHDMCIGYCRAWMNEGCQPTKLTQAEDEFRANTYCARWGQDVINGATQPGSTTSLAQLCNAPGQGARAETLATCMNHYATIMTQVDRPNWPTAPLCNNYCQAHMNERCNTLQGGQVSAVPADAVNPLGAPTTLDTTLAH